MKVALYARVSLEESNEQDRRYQEPENQLLPLREWAKTQNWEVYKEYVDRGSGANPAREQFRELMSDALQLRFRLILVWKLDRFTREGISQTFAYIEKLRNRGVAIKSLNEAWLDTSEESPVAGLLISVMSWAAAWERKNISDRTKLGIQRRKNLGIWKGGRPKKVKA